MLRFVSEKVVMDVKTEHVQHVLSSTVVRNVTMQTFEIATFYWVT